MAETLQRGQYRVGHADGRSRRDPEREVGVIRGDVANESRNGGFSRILGLAKSKWYVYEEVEHLRQYADQSGTGVLMVVDLVEECDSKSDAVEYAERRYDV